MRAARLTVLGALAAGAACASACAAKTSQAVLVPPVEPASSVRGDSAHRTLGSDDELAIDAVILTRFFHPWHGQARWIDPRPLADVRDVRADSTADADVTWAEAIRDAAGIARVCVLDPDADADDPDAAACRGRDGGVLRFSRPYATSPDAARVFVRYDPARDAGTGPVHTGTPAAELRFEMARDGRAWRIASHHTVHLGT
jgi:hypothetical protein